jgi:hypothetical protein
VLAEDGGVEELAIRLGGSLHPPILLDLSRNRESCRIAQRPPRAEGHILVGAGKPPSTHQTYMHQIAVDKARRARQAEDKG